ncbi:hypothetical protein [Rhabdothermincola salaria]|uniref:hypothetical protein n=1 Tax=Rhabdothermincola salaria TaxID=2903142 RepID=UPI001E5C7AEE|nr:hypothetical protein [Rhabdothermincola salaria]MCD9623747.1 hypothetical protein [Rhabdothermincola salaria]
MVGSSGTIASWEGGTGGGRPRWRCGYYQVEAKPSESEAHPIRYDLGPIDPVAGEAYVLACFDAADQMVLNRPTRFDPGDPLAGIAAAERALDEARRRLDLPLPQPALNPPGEQLVGVATWLWLADAWAPSSATAAIGAVSSTVTAQPVQVTWDMGDGTTLTCDAGVAYDPGRAPEEQSSACTHVYTRASAGAPGGRYPVTVTVGYEVSWSASTGAGGELEGLSRQTTIDVVVRQAQAVIR